MLQARQALFLLLFFTGIGAPRLAGRRAPRGALRAAWHVACIYTYKYQQAPSARRVRFATLRSACTGTCVYGAIIFMCEQGELARQRGERVYVRPDLFGDG